MTDPDDKTRLISLPEAAVPYNTRSSLITYRYLCYNAHTHLIS